MHIYLFPTLQWPHLPIPQRIWVSREVYISVPFIPSFIKSSARAFIRLGEAQIIAEVFSKSQL